MASDTFNLDKQKAHEIWWPLIGTGVMLHERVRWDGSRWLMYNEHSNGHWCQESSYTDNYLYNLLATKEAFTDAREARLTLARGLEKSAREWAQRAKSQRQYARELRAISD